MGYCSIVRQSWETFDSIHYQRVNEFAAVTSLLWDLFSSLLELFPKGLWDLLASGAMCHVVGSDRAPVAGSTKAKL
jgi:hypothetical protein